MTFDCLNWDKNSWLSSDEYFSGLNDLLIKKLNINHSTKILDIGCGRGHLLNNLSNKINFKKMLNGVEPVKHEKNNLKKIKIFNMSIQEFLKQNSYKYDVILMKQVLHLIPSEERKLFYYEIKKHFSLNGKLVIMQMNEKFHLPYFPVMKKKLIKSLSQHQIIEEELNNIFDNNQKDEYLFKVDISKKDYLGMIQDKFISVLSNLSKEEIKEGCNYIHEQYSSNISFIDKLDFIIVN